MYSTLKNILVITIEAFNIISLHNLWCRLWNF